MGKTAARIPRAARATIFVIFGDEEFQKLQALDGIRDEILPVEIDRSLALVEFDAGRSEEQGGPSLAGVFDDLRTLPLLADRRVVVIRDADRFISSHREALEKYAASPAPTGVLVLVCRSFPKTTRLHKAVTEAGGRVVECKKLNARGLAEFVCQAATVAGSTIDYALAERIVDQVGTDQGMLATEVEKLALFVTPRKAITPADVDALVGLSREERVFAAIDAAAAGDLPRSLETWSQVLSTDRAGAFKAVGGLAFKLRQWLAAQEMRSSGMNPGAIAPRVMMWGRERELAQLLQMQPAAKLKRMLAALADLDAQAKVGARSIEMGVEALLVTAASPSMS